MEKPIVIANSLKKGDEELRKQMQKASEALGLKEAVLNSRSVFIKPNLTYPVYMKGITTQVSFVRILTDVLINLNPNLFIFIGEGEGGYSSFSMTKAMHIMGFYDIEKLHSNIKIVNLSKLPSQPVELKVKRGPYIINLPSIFFEEIDFSITCPTPKVHAMTKITLSLKNQWGCLPDVMRLKNHYVFDEIISQICEKLKFRFAFLDGKYGLDNYGPMAGDPVEVNWFVASNSLGAFDMIVARMMGVEWRDVGHLKAADRLGFMPAENDITVLGDLERLKRKFVLKRGFWTYPALAAFKSEKLTDLVYLSKYSKILHDIMYLFRERPIDSKRET